jgi:hypothetical protein
MGTLTATFVGWLTTGSTMLGFAVEPPQHPVEPKGTHSSTIESSATVKVEYLQADREFLHNDSQIRLTAVKNEALASNAAEVVLENWGHSFVSQFAPKLILAGEFYFEGRPVHSFVINDAVIIACETHADDERLARWRLETRLSFGIARAFTKWRQEQTDIEGWKRLNPDGFEYTKPTRGGEGENKDELTKSRLRAGFLFDQSRTDVWVDLAWVLAAVASDDEGVAARIVDYKRLHAKFAFALDLLVASGWKGDTCVAKAANSASLAFVPHGGPWQTGQQGEWAAVGTAGFTMPTEQDPCAICNIVKRYPRGAIDGLIKVVYSTKELTVDGVPMPGTYGQDFVIITTPGTWTESSTLTFERSFHHELSSIVYSRYMSEHDRAAWLECNDPNFEYSGQTGEVNARSDGDSELLIDSPGAMLTRYSKMSLEDDFNMLAEWLFIDAEKVIAAAEQNERLGWKLKILIASYERADKRLTEAHFKNLVAREPIP